MKRAIITGATGVVGRALVDVCIDQGYEVMTITHRGSARAEALADDPRLRMMELDLSEYADAAEQIKDDGRSSSRVEPESQAESIKDLSIFFHLAWASPSGEGAYDPGVQTENVRTSLDAVALASALGCDTFVGVGSQAEYGATDMPLGADTITRPETAYGMAKLCAGQMTRLACGRADMRHIWTRVVSAYGPHDRDDAIITYAVNTMMAGSPTRFTPCEQMWDFIYAGDAARAILTAGEKGIDKSVYVIGSGEIHPLRYYIERVAELTKYDREIGFGMIPYKKNQAMHLEADMRSLRSIGFKPSVSFDEGIAGMIEISDR